MEKTTSAWRALCVFLCLAAMMPRGHGQCPVGVDQSIAVFSCTEVGFDLSGAVPGGGVERYEWRARADAAGIDGESLDWREGARITDRLTNTTQAALTVVYEVVPVGAGECRGAPFEVAVEVRVAITGCLGCNSLVNLTLGAGCRADLTLEEAAEGEESAGCADIELLRRVLYVAVLDGRYPGDDPARADEQVERTGTFTFEIRLRPEYEGCYVWTPCWGTVVVEDKTPPAVSCPADVVGLVRTVVPPSQAEAIVDGVPYRYRPGAGADAGCSSGAGCDDRCELPATGFTYLVCTDIDSIYQVKRSWDDEAYPYFTGRPGADDCSPVELTGVRDVLTSFECGQLFRYGRPVEARLERTFTFRDAAGNVGTCVQTIFFFRPFIALPACKVTLDLCEYPGISTADAGRRIDPVATATAPYFLNGMGRRRPLTTTAACRFSVEYADEALPGPEGCGIKVIRRWTFLDWCRDPADGCEHFQLPLGCEEALSGWVNKKRTYEQHLIIADDDKPKVSCPVLPDFSTGPFNCTAVIAPPAPLVSAECSSWSWEFELYGEVTDPKTGITRYNQLIATSVNRIVTGIAPGNYDLHYLVRDACGNQTRHICSIRVVDAIDPVAICNDDLQVSLGGANTNANGVARVAAADVDEGSHDNCGLAALRVRRQIPASCLEGYTQLVLGLTFPGSFTKKTDAQQPGVVYYLAGKDTLLVDERGVFFSWWADAVFFTCCDISTGPDDTRKIELRATDRAGNRNVCWLRVRVEDKLPPKCEVSNARIRCTDLDFDPNSPADVVRRFGRPEDVVRLNDNCGATIAETMRYLPGNCGAGLIERIFTVTDGSGLSTTCTQTITIEEVNQYTVRFPRDLNSVQCGVAPADSLVQASQGCDILAINRDTARYDATDDECFKLFITYTVINWCEYDGKSTRPTVIARDLDEDQNLSEYTWLEAGLDSAFAKKYLPAETEFFLVKLFAADGQGQKKALPERVFVRADCPGGDLHVGYRIWRHSGNGVFQEICRRNPASICADPTYSNQCWAPGYYQYTQIIKVYDNQPPALQVLSNTYDFCAYGDPATSCDARVDFAIRIQDNCTLTATELRRVELLLNRDPNRRFGPSSGLFQVQVNGNDVVISGMLPIGQHSFVVQAADGCGNLASRRLDFSIRDCKSPAPICINGVAITLMPVDNDGDGVVDGGMNTVWVKDLIASPVEDCSGEVTYSLNFAGETPDRTRQSLTVTCADPLFETLPIEVHAWDPLGNHDLCETFIVVEDLRGLCGPIGRGGIAGLVLTEEDEPVADVEVRLSGKRADARQTDDGGAYGFTPLEEGYDYSVTPFRDGDYLNGVTTFDLVLISKHILGVKPLISPYKLIAADANRSGSITTLDLIALRKVILNVDLRFTGNTSWRFVPANYAFPNPRNPFGASFPEVLNVNNLTGRYRLGDFVAIKVGDVNSSAIGSSLTAPVVRDREGVLPLTATHRTLAPGEEVLVPLYGAALAGIEGLQFTLAIDPAHAELVDVEEGLLRAGDYAVFAARGMLTASWVNLLPAGPAPDQPLLTLRLRARDAASLREVLVINSRLTPAEAYRPDGAVLDVVLAFEGGTVAALPALYQNYPNPFRATTVIGFFLPQGGPATLTVHDAAGRQLRLLRGEYAPGYQEIRLDRPGLPAAALFYTLEAGAFRATRSMVVGD